MTSEKKAPDNLEILRAEPAARRIAREEGIDLSRVKGSGPNGTILVKDIENFKISQKAPSMTSEKKAPDKSESIRAEPAARWMAKREGIDLSRVKGSGPNGTILAKDVENFKIAQKAPERTTGKEKVRASSLARRLAERKGVSLEAIEGTGIRNRIMMKDVIHAIPKSAIAPEGKGLFGQTIPMNRMRKVIAKRISQSAFTAPHVYFFTDVDMGKLNQARDQILLDLEKQFNVRISINDFLIKAVALTLREFPLLNAMVKGEEIVVMPDINIGLAVAMEEGLIVPAIPQADQLALGKIAQMRVDLVERARNGKLKMEEIERGTFTISSLAQYDIVFFTAILNPPQSGILSVGKTCEQLALKEGQVITKQVARLGLSADHRIVDGAVAAAFLQSLKNRIENPTFAFVDL
jgi:pyruvate dehydrogenase E2 component (dihydrolipoamide acetyltransferase)